MNYDFAAFLDEECGALRVDALASGTLRRRDHALGKLLMTFNLASPPVQVSFDTAILEFDASSDSIVVGHDTDLDREFTLSREEFLLEVKREIARSLAQALRAQDA